MIGKYKTAREIMISLWRFYYYDFIYVWQKPITVLPSLRTDLSDSHTDSCRSDDIYHTQP